MECESGENISYDYTTEIAANSQDSLAGGSRHKQQTVARINFGPKMAAILRILSGAALVAKQKFLEMMGCLRKCFGKN